MGEDEPIKEMEYFIKCMFIVSRQKQRHRHIQVKYHFNSCKYDIL